jgi:hypothetical protein
MYEIKATFKGVVPMMMDRYYDLIDNPRGPKKKKKGLDKAVVELKLHKDKKGVYVPADNIRMMLIGNKHRPGAAKILGSYIETKKATEYMQMCKSCIWVLGPDDPMKVYIEPRRKTYEEIDERSFINANGSRSIAYRPIINLPWTLTFIIQVTDDQIHESKVRELFDCAGLRCGVCAYGPTFGRCIITDWRLPVIKEAKKEVPTPKTKNHNKAKSHGKEKKKKTR